MNPIRADVGGNPGIIHRNHRVGGVKLAGLAEPALHLEFEHPAQARVQDLHPVSRREFIHRRDSGLAQQINQQRALLDGRSLLFQKGSERAPAHAGRIDGLLGDVAVVAVVHRVGQVNFIDDVVGQRNRVIAHVGDKLVKGRMPPQFGAVVEIRRGGRGEVDDVGDGRRVGQHFGQRLARVERRQRVPVKVRLVKEHGTPLRTGFKFERVKQRWQIVLVVVYDHARVLAVQIAVGFHQIIIVGGLGAGDVRQFISPVGIANRSPTQLRRTGQIRRQAKGVGRHLQAVGGVQIIGAGRHQKTVGRKFCP